MVVLSSMAPMDGRSSVREQVGNENGGKAKAEKRAEVKGKSGENGNLNDFLFSEEDQDRGFSRRIKVGSRARLEERI